MGSPFEEGEGGEHAAEGETGGDGDDASEEWVSGGFGLE
jgi:hypothetical protein